MVTSISKSLCRVVALNTKAAGSNPLRSDAELSPVHARPPATGAVPELTGTGVLGFAQLDPV